MTSILPILLHKWLSPPVLSGYIPIIPSPCDQSMDRATIWRRKTNGSEPGIWVYLEKANEAADVLRIGFLLLYRHR